MNRITALIPLALLSTACGPADTPASAPAAAPADRVTLDGGMECRMAGMEFDPAILRTACEQAYGSVLPRTGEQSGAAQQHMDMLGRSTLIVTTDRVGLLYDVVGNEGLFQDYTPADHSFLPGSASSLGPAIAAFQTALAQELSNQGHELMPVISSVPRNVVLGNERVNPGHTVVFDVDQSGEMVGDIHYDSGRGMVKIGEGQGERMVLDPLYPRAWDAARVLGIDVEADQPLSD